MSKSGSSGLQGEACTNVATMINDNISIVGYCEPHFVFSVLGLTVFIIILALLLYSPFSEYGKAAQRFSSFLFVLDQSRVETVMNY